MRLLLASLRRSPQTAGSATFTKYDPAKQRNAVLHGVHGALFLLFAAFALPSVAQDTLPLPRFVSLKADEVYMRAGPGTNYPVNWSYLRKGLPVEILKEYEDWRYVRDIDGAEGWIHRIMLSGSRSVIITGPSIRTGYDSPDLGADAVFRAEPGVQASFISCDVAWCRVEIDGVKGWMPMTDLWGVYAEDGDG
ncbi:MAG: hypothetical protein CMM46_02080 [Rhodospirillaceae bacterium]|nr:hypothetical protein [Rhodospirillaceae bacterium]|tara:strand:- start:7130 stop:7708 length:579 start_codon:yes stop_codon:yes gene_type:complete